LQDNWFDDLPVIGRMTRQRAVEVLRSIDEADLADLVDSQSEPAAPSHFANRTEWWPFHDRLWQHTAHSFGYIPLTPSNKKQVAIQHASAIKPDPTLQGSQVKITLDRLRVASYPGRGTHNVLFDFYAQNQLTLATEHLHFNVLSRVREGEEAALVGCPIFVGVNVGPEGLYFKCYTVNVKNEEDERFLRFLDSDTFRRGLKVAVSAQPVIGLFSETTLAVTRAIAQRNRNVPVQEFQMGLDFSTVAMRARLAEGSYIAVQIPQSHSIVWDWGDWVYQPSSGRIVRKDVPGETIPYNYLVFGLSKHGTEGDPRHP
jgi:hypothetical protein